MTQDAIPVRRLEQGEFLGEARTRPTRRKVLQGLGAVLLSATGAGWMIFAPIPGASQRTDPQTGIPEIDHSKYTTQDFLDAIVQIESDGNPYATRYEEHISDESIGLGQILIGTAARLQQEYADLPRVGNTREEIRTILFDPKINLAYTEALFQEGMRLYDHPVLAVAAYNAGRHAPRVARNQQQLNDLYKANLDTDGIRGELSGRVVERFQQEHGLNPDRIIGPNTNAKLQEVWQARFPGQPNPRGIVPQNNITPYHIQKFVRALQDDKYMLNDEHLLQ